MLLSFHPHSLPITSSGVWIPTRELRRDCLDHVREHRRDPHGWRAPSSVCTVAAVLRQSCPSAREERPSTVAGSAGSSKWNGLVASVLHQEKAGSTQEIPHRINRQGCCDLRGVGFSEMTRDTGYSTFPGRLPEREQLVRLVLRVCAEVEMVTLVRGWIEDAR